MRAVALVLAAAVAAVPVCAQTVFLNEIHYDDGSGAVVQFISYESTLTAVNGPAHGMTSTDIGIAESDETPLGYSLQLLGSRIDRSSVGARRRLQALPGGHVDDVPPVEHVTAAP